MKKNYFIFGFFIFTLVAVVFAYIFRYKPSFEMVYDVSKSKCYDKSSLVSEYVKVNPISTSEAEELLFKDSTSNTYRIIKPTFSMDKFYNIEFYIYCETDETNNTITKILDLRLEDENCKIAHKLYGKVKVSLIDNQNININVDVNTYQNVEGVIDNYTYGDDYIKLDRSYQSFGKMFKDIKAEEIINYSTLSEK